MKLTLLIEIPLFYFNALSHTYTHLNTFSFKCFMNVVQQIVYVILNVIQPIWAICKTVILKQPSTKMSLALSNANRSMFHIGCHGSPLTWKENCNKSTRFMGSTGVTRGVTKPRPPLMEFQTISLLSAVLMSDSHLVRGQCLCWDVTASALCNSERKVNVPSPKCGRQKRDRHSSRTFFSGMLGKFLRMGSFSQHYLRAHVLSPSPPKEKVPSFGFLFSWTLWHSKFCWFSSEYRTGQGSFICCGPPT